MKIIINSKERREIAKNLVGNIRGDENMQVTIEPYVENHTGEQQSYWHIQIREIAKFTGYTEPEAKEWVKLEILGTTVVEIGGKSREVVASSQGKKKDEYSELIEHTNRIAAELGIVLPPPTYREEN